MKKIAKKDNESHASRMTEKKQILDGIVLYGYFDVDAINKIEIE